jgi:hypothetical protein
MAKPNVTDPYAGNILTQYLGPILSREQALTKLRLVPSFPGDMSGVPKQIRLHMLMVVRDLHVPSLEGARVLETTDLVIRQGYRYRDPATAAVWAVVSDDPLAALRPRAPAMAAVVVGHSGVGKTVAIYKAFDCYGRQVIVHESFPRLKGRHYQMVHLSVDVPASGRAVDLAANLMIAWDDAVAQVLADQARRFLATLAKERRDGAKMMDEWRQVAVAHFLGGLHLDEVQNFFRIPSLERRRTGKAGKADDADVPLELSIIEDQALKYVLTLANTWQIPLIVSGTPDGVGALTKRLSNVQRFVTSGYHKMSEFLSATDPFFIAFMDTLGGFQYVVKRLSIDDEVRALVFSLTAGIQRLIVALWIAAHRVAFERREDSLRLDDFKKAAATYLAPVAPAVAALLSKDPQRMRRYEDLMPRDDGYWVTFWTGVSSL